MAFYSDHVVAVYWQERYLAESGWCGYRRRFWIKSVEWSKVEDGSGRMQRSEDDEMR
jgi:hypothetical protein